MPPPANSVKARPARQDLTPEPRRPAPAGGQDVGLAARRARTPAGIVAQGRAAGAQIELPRRPHSAPRGSTTQHGRKAQQSTPPHSQTTKWQSPGLARQSTRRPSPSDGATRQVPHAGGRASSRQSSPQLARWNSPTGGPQTPNNRPSPRSAVGPQGGQRGSTQKRSTPQGHRGTPPPQRASDSVRQAESAGRMSTAEARKLQQQLSELNTRVHGGVRHQVTLSYPSHAADNPFILKL